MGRRGTPPGWCERCQRVRGDSGDHQVACDAGVLSDRLLADGYRRGVPFDWMLLREAGLMRRERTHVEEGPFGEFASYEWWYAKWPWIERYIDYLRRNRLLGHDDRVAALRELAALPREQAALLAGTLMRLSSLVEEE